MSENIFKSLSTVEEVRKTAWTLMTRMVEDGYGQSDWFSMMAEELVKREQEIIEGAPILSIHPDTELRNRFPLHEKARQKIRWTLTMLEQLGTMSDPAFAKKWGMSANSAFRKRQSMRIPPFNAPKGGRRASRREGDRRGTIQWTDEMVADLGQMPDRAVGIKWKVSTHAVYVRRSRMGIPAWAGSRRGRPKGQCNIEWTDEMVSELGTMTDRVYAEKWGLTHSSVYKKRRKLKINPFDTARSEWRYTGRRG